jgi:hypothetical protein
MVIGGAAASGQCLKGMVPKAKNSDRCQSAQQEVWRISPVGAATQESHPDPLHRPLAQCCGFLV